MTDVFTRVPFMNSRIFVQAAALVATAFAAALHAATPARPNVLFVLSDDHSYPFLSCYGDGNVRTPALDQMAAEGMKFHRFFTAAPQCVPARAAYLTGRSAVAARMTRFSSPLPRDEITFPEMLREQAGYFTGICGRSYHLDGSAGSTGNVLGDVLDQHQLKTFEQRVDYLRRGSDTEAVEQMREFLAKKPAEKPFCLWLNFSDPHHPWTPPAGDRPAPASAQTSRALARPARRARTARRLLR
jgi:N-sulfoglucosamine sulfohydrolase